MFNTETHSNNGAGDASTHPTHPRGPALKKKSVAKAKIFFLLIAHSQLCTLQLHREYHTKVCFCSEESGRRISFRPIGTGPSPLGWKNFGWVAARPQPKRKINCETPFACEKIHFALSLGPLPLYHTQNAHENAKLNLSLSGLTFPSLV